MFKKIYQSLVMFQTIVNSIIALLTYVILTYFDLINFEEISALKELYHVCLFLFIWSLIECLTKKDNFYILFLYLLMFPIQQWFVLKGVTLGFYFFIILINYNFIFLSAFLIKIILKKKYKLKIVSSSRVLLPFYGCLLFAVSSIINSSNFYLSVNGVIYGLIVPFILFIIIFNILNEKKDINLIFEAILFTLLFHSVFTLILEATDLVYVGFGSGKYRGIFGSTLDLPPLLLIAILISLHLNFYNYKPLYVIAFFISVFLMLMTGSRGGLFCFLISMLLWVFSTPFNNRKLMKSLIATIAVIIVLLLLDVENFLETTKLIALSRAYSRTIETYRYLIWEETIHYLKDNVLILFGIGIGNYYYTPVIIGVPNAHNAFLQLATTIGLLGSILYHYIIIKQIRVIKLIFIKNPLINTPNIILIVLLLYINTVAYEIIFHMREEYLIRSINTHIGTTYLWLILGITYFVNSTTGLANHLDKSNIK